MALAAGVESMSRVPMTSDGASFSPAMEGRYRPVQQGLSAEKVADKWGLWPQAMEELALASHERALAAWSRGAFDDEVVPAEGLPVHGDGPPRPLGHPGAVRRALGRLRSVGADDLLLIPVGDPHAQLEGVAAVADLLAPAVLEGVR